MAKKPTLEQLAGPISKTPKAGLNQLVQPSAIKPTLEELTGISTGGAAPTVGWGEVGKRFVQGAIRTIPSLFNPRIVIPGLYKMFQEPYQEMYQQIQKTPIGQIQPPGVAAGITSGLATAAAIPKALIEPGITATKEWFFEPEKKAQEFVERPFETLFGDIMSVYITGSTLKGILSITLVSRT